MLRLVSQDHVTASQVASVSLHSALQQQMRVCALFVQVSFGSPGRSNLGGVGDHVDLSGLPRNFSLSDLALDQVNEGEHGLPHNISLSDLPAFDIDSGGEQS